MSKYVKPTLETKFHIDFNWWQKMGNWEDMLLEAEKEADIKPAQ